MAESHMLDNLLACEAAHLREKECFKKLDYAFDTRIYWWLESFKLSIERELVNENLINFNTIPTEILEENFFQHLPYTTQFV